MIDVNNKLFEWREFYGYKQKQVAEAMGGVLHMRIMNVSGVL